MIDACRGSPFDELEFFRAIATSGARALLIKRQALIALGMPVMTADYDFWLHGDDIAVFNAALAPFEMYPTRSPEEARTNGRYAVEGDEHVDVLVARAVSTVDGVLVRFEDVWLRREHATIDADVTVAMPCLDELILTKRFGARPRDADDIPAMTLPRLSPDLRAELAAEEDRRLSAAELDARVHAPWSAQEIEDFDALVHWFRTRYLTAGERLRAIRRRMMQLRQRAR